MAHIWVRKPEPSLHLLTVPLLQSHTRSVLMCCILFWKSSDVLSSLFLNSRLVRSASSLHPAKIEVLRRMWSGGRLPDGAEADLAWFDCRGEGALLAARLDTPLHTPPSHASVTELQSIDHFWFPSSYQWRPTLRRISFALSSLWHLNGWWRNVSHYSLSGLLDQSPTVQQSDFKKSRWRRESSAVLPVKLLIFCTVSHLLLLKKNKQL